MLNSHHTHCFSQLLHQGTLYKALLSSQDYCCAVVKFSTVPLLCLLRYHLATSSYNSNAKDSAVHLRRGWIGRAESCPMQERQKTNNLGLSCELETETDRLHGKMDF